MTAATAAGGTLCRLIPLDRIDGRIVKWRVEVGDLGDSIGTVLKAAGRDEWEAFYVLRGDTEPRATVGSWETPEAAALAISTLHFCFADDGQKRTRTRPLAAVR